MKGPGFLLSVMMIMLAMIISCSKKNDDPQTVTKKPYAWVAGERDSTGYGMILFSADSGETWVRQGQGTTALKDIDVSDIWAVDENTVWAVCSDNVILKTLDRGQAWARIQAPMNKAGTRLLAIYIMNKTNIWISGSGGTVYKSADNGNTWTMFDTTFFHNGLMQGIWAVSLEKVYVVGGVGIGSSISRGFIALTLNGGNTWDSIVPSDNYNKHEWIGVTSCGNKVVVYGGRSHYLVSTDGGGTWKNDSVPNTGGIFGADINHLIMLDPQTWWGAFDLGHIYLTKDGGNNWTKQETGQTGEYLVGIDAWNSQFALAVGDAASMPRSGPILKTSNGGSSWVTKKTYRSSLYKVSFIKQ